MYLVTFYHHSQSFTSAKLQPQKPDISNMIIINQLINGPIYTRSLPVCLQSC